MIPNYDQLKAKFMAAKSNRHPFEEDLRDTYRLCAPQDYYGGLAGELSSNWESQVLDSTATAALNMRVASVQSNLFPTYEDFLTFEIEGSGSRAAQDLDIAKDRFHQCLRDSNFFEEIPITIKNALISTGCMVVEKTNDPFKPINFKSVSAWNMYPVENNAGRLDKVFIVSNLTKMEAKEKFTGYFKIDDIYSGADDKIKIVEYYQMHDDGTTDYAVFCEDSIKAGNILFKKEGLRERRLIACRFGRTAGRAVGIGPCMQVLPEIRQVNYLTALSNEDREAAFKGYVAFDFDEIPTSHYTNSTTGINLIHTPSGQERPHYHQWNYNNKADYALGDLQTRITTMIQGPATVPPSNLTAKSAQEIMARQQEKAVLEVPTSMTLYNELERQLVMTVLAILRSEDNMDSEYYIPSPPGVKFKPINRFANIEGKKRASDDFVTLAQLHQIFPNGEHMHMINVEEWIRTYLKNSGVSSSLVYSEEELEEIKQEMLAKQQEAAANATAQGGQAAGGGGVALSGGIAPAQINQGVG